MRDLSMNKRVFCTKVAKYITPTNQRTPRVQKILPEGPQAGEKSMSARSTDYSHQGPPASQPPEGRWLRRLAGFGRTSGSAEPEEARLPSGRHVALATAFAMAVALGPISSSPRNRLTHTIKGGEGLHFQHTLRRRIISSLLYS